MNTPARTARPRKLLFLLVSYAIWASVTIRWITEYLEQQHPLILPVSGMLVLFGVLMGLEPWITRGSHLRAHLYLGGDPHPGDFYRSAQPVRLA